MTSPDTIRWVIRRKAQVVAAVRGGLLSLEEVCSRYTLTPDEFLSCQAAIDQHGLAGLRTTRIRNAGPNEQRRNCWQPFGRYNHGKNGFQCRAAAYLLAHHESKLEENTNLPPLANNPLIILLRGSAGAIAFRGQLFWEEPMQLILKPDPTDKTPNRFVVLSDGIQVGRIFDRVPGASAARNANWCWTIAGKYCRDCGLGVGGDAATREDAIAAFRKTWDEHAT